MYIGALMPPSPIRPMNSPCPIHSGQGGPKVEIVSPAPIISAPNITVQRVPTRSAMRPIMMPPAPEQSQASAEASAGIERMPPTSAAMSFSATAVIQAAPNAIIIVTSATEATTQDARLSIEEKGDCNIKRKPGWRSFYRLHRIWPPMLVQRLPRFLVMAGLVPAIHALLSFQNGGRLRLT